MKKGHRRTWKEIIKTAIMGLAVILFSGGVNTWNTGDVPGGLFRFGVAYIFMYAAVNAI